MAALGRNYRGIRFEADRVWGTGLASREFLHIEDCGRTIAVTTKHYDDAAPADIGAGREIAIRQLAGLVAELSECRGEIGWTSKPDSQPRGCLDVATAEREFGFALSPTFATACSKP